MVTSTPKVPVGLCVVEHTVTDPTATLKVRIVFSSFLRKGLG